MRLSPEVIEGKIMGEKKLLNLTKNVRGFHHGFLRIYQ